MIGEPPLYGKVQVTKMLVRFTEVTTLVGVSGTFAALIITSFEKALLPTRFLASTFHL